MRLLILQVMFGTAAWAASLRVAQAAPEGTPGAPSRPELAVDIDIDPIAYVFKGYSVHTGIMSRALSGRVSIGAYGIEAPEFFHGEEGYTSFKSGFTIKADYFFGSDLNGFHAGISTGLGRDTMQEKATKVTQYQYEAKASGRFGYRWMVYEGFYINPWFGFGVVFNPKDYTLPGKTIESKRFEYIPTLHLGYRFDVCPRDTD